MTTQASGVAVAAASAGDDLAAGHDRPRRLQGGVHRIVEDLRLPHHLAGDGVDREPGDTVAALIDEDANGA